MENPITWFEIIAPDSARLHKFYKDVFGWKMTPPVKEMGNYSMLEDPKPGPGIGGGIGDGPEIRVSVYAEVTDPQRYVDKAVASGARLIMPVTTITPTTTIAMLLDPAGNTFGVMKTQRQAPAKTARRSTAAKKKPAARARKKTTTAARKRTATRRTATRRRR